MTRKNSMNRIKRMALGAAFALSLLLTAAGTASATAGWAFGQAAAPNNSLRPGNVSSAAFNHQAEELTAIVKQLSAEVKALKFELRNLQLDFLQGKVMQLERELQQAQAERRRLEAQESAFNEELAALDKHLNQSTLPAEERKDVKANKAELSGSGMETLRVEQQNAAQQEAELNQRLEQEQKRLREIAKAAGKT